MCNPTLICDKKKNFSKLGIEWKFLNLIKTTKKPTANIIFNDEKLKAFALRSIIRQGCHLLPLFFKIVLEALAIAVRQKREIKYIQIRKEDMKVFVCR